MYEKFASPLLAVCIRYMGSRDEAEDVLHDVFLKIFDKLDRFEYRSDAELGGWVKRVTVNYCLDQLRKGRLKNVSLDSLLDIPEEETDTGEVRKIPPAELMKMVSDLPDGYRTVFNLFCIEGWSHREIGLKLGIGERSSSSQYFRARALLAKKIKDWLNEQEG